MRAKFRLTVLALLAGFAGMPAAHAATATTTFTVTANVAATCSATATTLDFGTYTGAEIDAANAMSVTCTNGTTKALIP